jgi:general stress protein 26
MADLDLARTDPEKLLWRELRDVRAGMLGVEQSYEHMQPMSHHADLTRRTLWFLTRKDTDLVERLPQGARAHFVIISKEQDFHACMSGVLVEQRDEEMLDEMWGRVAASWYDGGREDPNLAMLALKLDNAAIWASTSSSIAFAWEIAKANVTGGAPDVGVRNEVTF